MKFTKQKLKHLIKEEKQSAKMYRAYGLPQVSKDETKHSKILTKMLGGKK
jgi:hypothetical protein